MANLVTTSITALNGTATATDLENFGTAGIIITGTWVGTLSIQGSLNGSNFVPIFGQDLSNGQIITSTTSNKQLLISVAGIKAIRLEMTAYTSGTADVVIQANAAIGFNRTLSSISGATDNTQIGNVGDKLKVDASSATVSVISQDSAQYYCDNNQLYSVASGINMASAGTDNPLILFRNPTGSGKTIFIWKIVCGVTVANVSADFRIFNTPTVTSNGTTLTPAIRNINNSQPDSSALLTSLPTVSSSGSLMESFVSGQNSISSTSASDFSICLQQNSAILITGNPLSNNRNSSITVVWTEV